MNSSIFTYGDPGHAVHLPHAKLIWMNEYAGTIVSILVSNSPEKLSIDDLSRSLDALCTQFRSAGWKETFAPPTLQALKQAIAGGNGTVDASGVAQYAKNGTVAQFTPSSPGGPLQNGLLSRKGFVLQVNFANDKLDLQESVKVYNERQWVNGKDRQSLAPELLARERSVAVGKGDC